MRLYHWKEQKIITVKLSEFKKGKRNRQLSFKVADVDIEDLYKHFLKSIQDK